MEVREHLPKAQQKSLSVNVGELTLRMPQDAQSEFSEASGIVSKVLERIKARPVIPRELEDILGISTTERRRCSPMDDCRAPAPEP